MFIFSYGLKCYTSSKVPATVVCTYVFLFLYLFQTKVMRVCTQNSLRTIFVCFVLNRNFLHIHNGFRLRVVRMWFKNILNISKTAACVVGGNERVG